MPFSQSAMVTQYKEKEAAPWKPFYLPEVQEGEELIDYVCQIKAEYDKEFFTVGGIDFNKKFYPVEAAYVKNEGISFEPLVPVKRFTKKQADVLFKKLEETIIDIPGRPDRKTDIKPGEEVPWLPAQKFKASEIVYFCPTSEYNPYKQEKKIAEDDKVEADLETKAEENYKNRKKNA